LANDGSRVAGMGVSSELTVARRRGGGDTPYVYGMVDALIAKGLAVGIVRGDDLDCSGWHGTRLRRFLNPRGDMREDASLPKKISRVLIYYVRLLVYAATAKPKIFHIIWNNKFEYFDRTLLMLYYKTLGKHVILTAHNVNKSKRDCTDTRLNRLTLKIQYRLRDHVFVHTEQMKRELINEYGGHSAAITVIPFGINNAVPISEITSAGARRRLNIGEEERVILFFGRIVPYKGLEYLVAAFQEHLTSFRCNRLIIAGRPEKDCRQYFDAIRDKIEQSENGGQIMLMAEYVPDNETELYFKAVDVLVLPYRDIYQSGVLFLAYSFGLPVVATDVGALREEIVEGKTGFVCKPENPADLARAIQAYFCSDLFKNLNGCRNSIQQYARQRYSWNIVGELTKNVYEELLGQQ